MHKDWHRLYWDWRGGISRRVFWLGQISLWICYLLLQSVLDHIVGHRSTVLLCPFMLWALAILMIKRLRDRGKSPLWLALLLLPVLGPIWCLVDLGLLPGTLRKHRKTVRA